MWRWVLGAIASLIVGVIFLSRYLTDLPALEKLDTVTGEVTSVNMETRRSRRSQTQVLAVQIGDKPTAFYLDRFPDFDRIAGTIRPGDRVTARVDVGQNNWIWQLERGDERLVSYDQVAAAQQSNNRNNGLLGLLFFVVGLGTLGVTMWRWRAGSPAAQAPNEKEDGGGAS